MGRKIDQFVLSMLSLAIIYALFAAWMVNPLASSVLTFCSGALIYHIRRRFRRPEKMTVIQAQSILLQWACLPDEEAKAEIARIAAADADDVILPRHPSFTVSSGDIFNAWKQHQGAKHLRIIATCYADGRTKTFARSLQSPSVEIVDASRLIPMIRRSNLPAPRIPLGREAFRKLKALLIALPERYSWRKNLLFGTLLLPVYLLTGNAAYLFLSLAALFLAGIALRTRRL